MEPAPVTTALKDHETVPATHCPHCDSRVLFWWTNPKGRTVTWFCPACRMVTTRGVSESNGGPSTSTVS